MSESKDHNSWKSSITKDGAYKRKASAFRNWISQDGEFPPEKDRYHLYVSYACPWAHRTLITRALKGLEGVISVSVVDWFLGKKGWKFSPEVAGATKDDVNGAEYLREIYNKADADYDGNITVPVLFDKKKNTIVNNESSEIIVMLNSQFNEFSSSKAAAALDLNPDDLAAAQESVNEWVYPTINNGVYRCGFARAQEPYEKAFDELFGSLDRVEAILSKQRYLTGDRLTLADIRLFTTLIRFDPVYVVHFKCNKHRIIDYPNIYGYMKELYQMEGVKATVNFEHIKNHYYKSHTDYNPFGIVAKGDDFAHLDEPHGRS